MSPMRCSRHSKPKVGVTAVAVAALAFGIACDVPPPTVPTNPIAPVVGGVVEIIGPDTMAPGQSAQFTAIVGLTDGARKTGSPAEIMWSFHTVFLRVNADGVATAQDRVGDTTLSARANQGRVGTAGAPTSASRVITIVPEGTFRLVGRVSDGEAPSVPIWGATVEVTPGSLVTTTNSEGLYRLYGVPADATVRITAPGFQPVERSVRLTAHATQDFGLPPDGERPVLTGPYTLAVDFSGTCFAGNFSDALLHRRYDAVLTQNGPIVDVALVEPRFRVNSIGRGNRFTGVAYSGGATFRLSSFDPDTINQGPLDYPNVVEQLPDGTVLIPSGLVVTKGGAAGLTSQAGSGVTLSRFGAPFPAPGPSFFGSCWPAVFTLTPR